MSLPTWICAELTMNRDGSTPKSGKLFKPMFLSVSHKG